MPNSTVESNQIPIAGGIGEVGGLSTSDSALLKETFPNSPFWKSDESYTPSDLEKDFDSLVNTGKVEKGYLFPDGFNRDFDANEKPAVPVEMATFAVSPALGRSSAESQSAYLTPKTPHSIFEDLVLKGPVADIESDLPVSVAGFEFSSFNRHFSANKEAATGLATFGVSPALGRSSDVSQAQGESTQVSKEDFQKLLKHYFGTGTGPVPMYGTLGAIDLDMRRNAYSVYLQGIPDRGFGTGPDALSFLDPAITKADFDKLVLEGAVKDTIGGESVAGYDFSSFNLGFTANEENSAVLDLPLASSPGMGRWKDDSAARSETKKTSPENFNTLVLRGGVIGGFEFPEFFNRDYTGGLVEVDVTEHNSPGDAFEHGGKIEFANALPGNKEFGPPNIAFGNIPVHWKPGDPANAFTPNPSSSPWGDPSKQHPPPAAIASNDWSWKSRPPFVGAGTDLSPRKSSEEMSKHTLGSYLLGSSKVEGE